MASCYSNWLQLVSRNGKWIFENQTYTHLQKSIPMRYITRRDTDEGFEGVFYSYLPHLLALIIAIFLVSRILHWFLRFLKQPLIICQLTTGILIFSFLPKPKEADNNGVGLVLNPSNRRVEHVIGSVGILFNLFIAGVKIDPTALWQFGKRKPLIIGFASLFLPMAVGFIVYVLKHEQLELLDGGQNRFIVLVLYPLCATYPVALYEILAELGLLNSELGRLALSSSLIQGTFGFLCLLVYTAVRQGQKSALQGVFAFISVLATIVFIVLVIRPYALWIVRTTPPYARVREVHILVITLVVFCMGLLSDLSGSSTYADAAILTGLAIPDGPPLGKALIERVDVVVSEVLLPLVFMHEGFYIDLKQVVKQKLNVSLWLGFLMLVTFITKIVANIAAALYCQMPLKHGFLLGFMMNFRGLVDMLYFIRLANTQLVEQTTFAVLVLATIIITAICVPVISIYYKPSVVRKQIGLRAVERARFHAELNVMACFYDDKPVQALLEFLESLSFSLEADNSTRIYSLHLVEQQGRAVSSLICHRTKKGYISTVQMDSVHSHFITFEQTKSRAIISVMPFTSVAPLNSMHHDICSLVLENNISLVIVPYPKKNSIADVEANTTTHGLVPLVLEQAQCSVGIMVYHGTTRIMGHSYQQYHVGILFWGGPDDRESIAIASRMARHQGVYLSVIRFLTSGSTTDQNDDDDDDDDDDATDKKVSDDQMITELQVANAGNNRVTVSEISVRNVEQVISAIHAIGDAKYDLLIVGRKQGNLSVLGDDMTKWTESPNSE